MKTRKAQGNEGAKKEEGNGVKKDEERAPGILLALVFSVKSRDRKNLSDYNGAQSYGSTAKQLNIAALVVSIIITIVFIALFFIRTTYYTRL
ncbi:PREDICTED: dispanin subfamily A member 2b-like [Acanthisitta chloris]|uniref:dispanin subfamily A member 2b-like n=1 Tax=Acanthisitta chloris TaxID=57068 RepID=UPI0004F0E795|nr:PREDICTED: dispanin subfamily A member 2b-like [Acanthisitta chloris]